jgi:hypothetical protein
MINEYVDINHYSKTIRYYVPAFYKNVKAQQQCGLALGRTIQLEQQYYV